MFTEWFGGAPHARVFDFLAEDPQVDHTITDISREADVARPTVYKVLDDFEEKDLVVETRQVGNSRLFQLNLENRTVHDLLWVLEPELEEPAFAEFEFTGPEAGESRSTNRQRRKR
jgi:DNA-binding transcriptional ArsR family regulator